LNVKVSANTLNKLINHYGLHTKEQLYAEIGMGLVNLDDLETTLLEKSVNKFIKFWKLSFGGDKKNGNQKIDKQIPFILNEDQKNENYTLALCCNPIPGDDVVGFVSDNNKIIIHNKSCPEAIRLMSSHGDDIVEASWTKSKVLSYLIHLYIRGFDQQGIAHKITNLISNEYQINMRSINLDAHDGIFEGNLYLYVHNTNMLDTVISKLLNIKGVDTVSRKDI
jgi:GTP pyrophosphokinase